MKKIKQLQSLWFTSVFVLLNALAYYTVSSVYDDDNNNIDYSILCMLVMYLYSSFNLLTYTVDVMYSYGHGITRP